MGLRFGPLGASAVHLCIDMQELFAGPTPWHTPSLARILPHVERIVVRDPARTIFTRFIPARTAEEAPGTWRRYYEHWRGVTLDVLDASAIELMPALRAFTPPAELLDKTTYAPWPGGELDASLARRHTDTLVITGAETDVCVLGAVLGAVDRGLRVVLVDDALCSASDDAHDAVLANFRSRYALQVEIATTGEVLAGWGS